MGFGLALNTRKTLADERLATDKTVASLTRPLTPLFIDSPISKVVEVLRQSNLDAWPVVSGGRFVTMIPESALSSVLLSKTELEISTLKSMPLSSILDDIVGFSPTVTVLHNTQDLDTASRFFNLNPETSVVAVVDAFRSYRGVISRSDVLAYRVKTLAPSRVGGMATPLGVYLTDGVQAGGVGDVGLFLAGATLTTLFASSMILMNWLDAFALSHQVDINGVLETALMKVIPFYAVTLVTDIRAALPLFMMLILLRLIPVAGYHAAEHQVVHCIERGEPLVPDVVAKMPRPHPRCGTNLVAAVLLFGSSLTILTAVFSSMTAAIVPSALLTLVCWRQVGTFFQQYFTTRPASPKQLASGIRAGTDLLDKYRTDINRRGNWPLRVWRMGFVQLLAGTAVPGIVLWLLATYVPVVQPYLQGIY